MKTIFYSLIFSVILYSCKKQTETVYSRASAFETPAFSQSYLARVRTYMQSEMPDSLYKSLDSTSAVLTQESSWYFRIGFNGVPMDQKFLLLKTDSAGNVSNGKIIELSRIRNSDLVFNGELRVRTIAGESQLESTITNGFVDAWKTNQSKIAVNSVGENMFAMEDPVYEELPEVDVYPDGSGGGGGISDGDIYLLLSGLSDGYSSGTGYSISGGSVTYTRAASPAATPAVRTTTNRPVTVKVETSYKNPAINVKSFLNCFSAIPNTGASYSVNVYVDLPVDNDPTQFFDPYTGATGHVFLGMTKTSAGQSVTQFIGFTAANALSAITSSQAVAGKVVDNSGHKYSAMLSTPVSAAEFSAAMNQLQSQSSAQYDIVNYNCVDFALGVVNSARGSYPLIINKYPVPDEPTPMSTPEALYNTISSMSRPGGPEAANTSIGNVWSAGSSHGACN